MIRRSCIFAATKTCELPAIPAIPWSGCEPLHVPRQAAKRQCIKIRRFFTETRPSCLPQLFEEQLCTYRNLRKSIFQKQKHAGLSLRFFSDSDFLLKKRLQTPAKLLPKPFYIINQTPSTMKVFCPLPALLGCKYLSPLGKTRKITIFKKCRLFYKGLYDLFPVSGIRQKFYLKRYL